MSGVSNKNFTAFEEEKICTTSTHEGEENMDIDNKDDTLECHDNFGKENSLNLLDNPATFSDILRCFLISFDSYFIYLYE